MVNGKSVYMCVCVQQESLKLLSTISDRLRCQFSRYFVYSTELNQNWCRKRGKQPRWIKVKEKYMCCLWLLLRVNKMFFFTEKNEYKFGFVEFHFRLRVKCKLKQISKKIKNKIYLKHHKFISKMTKKTLVFFLLNLNKFHST